MSDKLNEIRERVKDNDCDVEYLVMRGTDDIRWLIDEVGRLEGENERLKGIRTCYQCAYYKPDSAASPFGHCRLKEIWALTRTTKACGNFSTQEQTNE